MKELLLDNQKIAEAICGFLRKEFAKRKKNRAILGLSGGMDSTLTAFLCRKAGLDLCGLYLPCGSWRPEEKRVHRLAKILNLSQGHFFVINITPSVALLTGGLRKKIKLDRIDVGNIMARTRMLVLYAFARKFNGLVVGTGNLSEYLLGYFTRYGDESSDIAPIRGLFKTQVHKLAEFLGMPEEIIGQEPTAGLWRGQTDERELGFSYEQADPILYLACIKKHSKDELVKKYGFNGALVKRVLERIRTTEYKREVAPTYQISGLTD